VRSVTVGHTGREDRLGVVSLLMVTLFTTESASERILKIDFDTR